MELGWRNEVGSLAVKDQGISEKARSDEDRLINGLEWSYDYIDHDQTGIHVQIVPELHKEEEEEKSKKDLLVVVPDEHSETGDYHLSEDYSDSSDNRWFLRNKHEKPKRRRIQISSDVSQYHTHIPITLCIIYIQFWLNFVFSKQFV